MSLPEVVVTVDESGEKVFTFSGMSEMCVGTRLANGRLRSDFDLRPAPTSVLKKRHDEGENCCLSPAQRNVPSRLQQEDRFE